MIEPAKAGFFIYPSSESHAGIQALPLRLTYILHPGDCGMSEDDKISKSSVPEFAYGARLDDYANNPDWLAWVMSMYSGEWARKGNRG
jgi:hypothetical protein